MSDFFAMGGYAAFVWPAYGFAASVLVGLVAHSWRGARQREAELEQLRRIARPPRSGHRAQRIPQSASPEEAPSLADHPAVGESGGA